VLTSLFGLLDMWPQQQVGSLDAGFQLPKAEEVLAMLTLTGLCHCCTASLKAHATTVLPLSKFQMHLRVVTG